MDVGNDCVGIGCQLGLEGAAKFVQMFNRTNRTHIKDMKDPLKVLHPSDNLPLIALREDVSEHCISFTLLDDLPLYPRHGSSVEISVSGRPAMHIVGLNSRGQIPNRIEDGLVESI